MKSLSESNPDSGLASAPVEFHLSVDGRVHVGPVGDEVAVELLPVLCEEVETEVVETEE